MSTNTVLSPVSQAAAQHFEYFGDTLVTNYVLRIVVVLLVALCAFLGFELSHVARARADQYPIGLRIDESGRPDVIDTRYRNYTPAEPELRFFLTQFCVDFYSRNHRTLDQLYPAALFFLAPNKYNEVDAADAKSRWALKFIRSGDDNIDIKVKNVVLDTSNKALFRGQVEMDKLFTNIGGAQTKRQPFVVTIWFTVNPSLASKNNDLVTHNPLGFQIQEFREDKAFSE
jgi:hypothetical protein